MTTEEPPSPAEQVAIERLRAVYVGASRIDWPFSPTDVMEQSPHTSRRRRRGPGPWAHRVIVVAVAAAILVVFFVPLPQLNLYKRLVNPSKVSPAGGSNTVPKRPRVWTQVAELK